MKKRRKPIYIGEVLSYNGVYLGYGKNVTANILLSKYDHDDTTGRTVECIVDANNCYAFSDQVLTDTVVFHRTPGTLNEVAYCSIYAYRSRRK